MSRCHLENSHYMSVVIADFLRHYLFLPAHKRSTCYGNVAGWLGGWVAVRHSRYCIKTTKPILKLFGSSSNPII